MRRTIVLAAAVLAGAAVTWRGAAAVDLALVLLTDVLRSMDDEDYAMVKNGYRQAFADPDVAAAIGLSPRGVAVAYVEFSSAREIMLVRGWEILTDADSARAFGEAVATAPRSSAGETALAASLRQAALLLREGDFGDARLVIDVTSDHPWDGGRSVAVRDAIVAEGITINALPIVDERPYGTIDGRLTYTTYQQPGGIAEFFRREVIGGDGAFVVEARDHAAYGEALKRKLLRELIAMR